MAKRAKPTEWYTADKAAGFCNVKPAAIRGWLNSRPPFMRGEKRTYGEGQRKRWMIKGSEINRVLDLINP